MTIFDKVQKFKSEAHVGKGGLVSGRDYLRFANIQEKKLKYIQENTGIYRNQTRVNHVSQCDIQIQYRIYYTSDTQETFTFKDFELYTFFAESTLLMPTQNYYNWFNWKMEHVLENSAGSLLSILQFWSSGSERTIIDWNEFGLLLDSFWTCYFRIHLWVVRSIFSSQ